MRITKLLAALEQLDCAIRLHFEDSSPVSVCTLVGASSRILTDLIELKSPGSSWDANVQKNAGLTKKEYFAIARKVANSSKHADRDPHSEIDIDFIEVDQQIILATLNAAKFNKLSVSQTAFQVWYFSIYGLSFNLNSPVVQKSISIIGNMHEMHRTQQLERGLKLLQAQFS